MDTTISWQTVANVATSLALLVAVGVFIWQIVSHREEKAYNRSHFALQSALESYDQALELLVDGNNDRVTWITAARIVERANRICADVTQQVHEDVLEVQLERYRRQFARTLGFDDPSKGGWFFYGANSCVGLTTAAEGSTRPTTTGFGSKAQLKYLSESSLATLFSMAGYPSNYEDPLKSRSFAEKLGLGMSASFPGLFEYLEHREDYESIDGKLIRREARTKE